MLFLASSAAAQEKISSDTLAEIKRATVFVKVKAQGREGSGSGFVVKVDGNTALVVTNHHVVEPKIQIEIPTGPSIRRPGFPVPPSWTPRWLQTTLKNAAVTLVLESGTKTERSFKAELLAVDPQRDLAILRISDVKNLPKPIDFSRTPKLSETMSVYTFGFPFGNVLAASKGNPAITVGKAAISSLRNDDNGDLAVVQIDGNLNPGNSGGPVVDSRGQLIGVAVATIRNSSGIGLTIPAAEVGKMFQGRLGTFHVMATPPENGATRLRVEVAVIDPLGKISSVDLYCLPARDPNKKIQSLEREAGAKKIRLTIDKQLAVGEVVLNGEFKNPEVLLQGVYTNAAGKDLRSQVIRQRVGGPIVAKVKPQPRPVKRPPVQTGNATKIMGGSPRDELFIDEGPDGGILIGLELGFGTFASKEIISAVRPIYRTKAGEVRGKQHGADIPATVTLKAKDGYAVGSITVRTSLPIFGLSVNFMRVKDGKLDLDDSYQSRWIGVKTTFRQTTLEGDGTPIVGIVGKTNARGTCSGLGLLLKRSAR
ncbi:MAG: trypsin-like peptidase domain-containing protein [Planctomycetes bacterium]|nr:trypsin-like peptidase domain-containing protein [Planctomycetota bacterium]